MGFFFSFSFFLIFLFNMLKLPRLVQYDILNLTGTHSMKTPPEQGCGDYSRHAPKAAVRGGGRTCRCRPRRGRAAPRHTPAPLPRGNGSEKAGPEVCGEVHRRGRVFLRLRCRLRPVGCRAPSLPPQRRELHRPQCRSAAEGHGAAQPTAARGDDKHPAPAQPELLPPVPCRGGTPCRALLPACLPAKAGGSKPVQRRRLQKGLAAALRPCRRLRWEWTPPPGDAGEGGEPRAHLCVPMGRGASGERGSSARVRAGGVTPAMLPCPSGFSGQGAGAGAVRPRKRPVAPCTQLGALPHGKAPQSPCLEGCTLPAP